MTTPKACTPRVPVIRYASAKDLGETRFEAFLKRTFHVEIPVNTACTETIAVVQKPSWTRSETRRQRISTTEFTNGNRGYVARARNRDL
jgi:hypothetical protein